MLFVRRVVGASMLPLFRPGTLVLAWQYKKPKVGDVVVAKRGTLEIIKRVSSITPDGYFLLGDNASASTDSRTYGWFDPVAVKGVVIGRLAR